MNFLKKMLEVSMPLNLLRQSNFTGTKSRKQELIDLALTLFVCTLIVVYKVNKQ
ncbi:MAG: hypothetical protein NVS1B13_09280 [Flavisolibacter sp.]